MERTRRLGGGTRAGIALGTAIALVGFAIGVSVASIPASNGAINSCYSTRTGALRVIDYPSKKCGSGERFLRWNQTGPSSVAALRGTPCTAGAGTAGTTAVTVSATDGTISMQCRTVLSVAGSVTLDRIDLAHSPGGAPLVKECAVASSCAASYPLGSTTAYVHLIFTAPFGYTCPGGASTRSIAFTAQQQHGECHNVVMTTNRAVVVTP
jgi:hypothetical protein